MTLGEILVFIVLVASLGFLFGKGMSKFFDWHFEVQGRRAANKIEIGSRWRSKSRDPWSETSYATIVDKRDGWLRYRYDDSNYEWSARALWWTDSWERV